MSYDTPNATVRREWFINAAAGANAEIKFRTFQKIILKKVHVVAVTAGTSATTGHGCTVYSGTTSLATIALNTQTAGYSASTAALDAEIAALGQISVKNGTDATGAYHAILEYEVRHDATQS